MSSVSPGEYRSTDNKLDPPEQSNSSTPTNKTMHDESISLLDDQDNLKSEQEPYEAKPSSSQSESTVVENQQETFISNTAKQDQKLAIESLRSGRLSEASERSDAKAKPPLHLSQQRNKPLSPKEEDTALPERQETVIPTSYLPRIQSASRTESSTQINVNVIDPSAPYLPPTPLIQLQKLQPTMSGAAGRLKHDNGMLPRRKSRAPYGERLSLVQYDHPEPVPPGGQEESEIFEVDPVEELKKIANCSLPPIEPEKQLRCIMDCILPPRKRDIDGKSWLERASTVPSTRLDILGLQQRFETELNVSHAKSFGICPIRRRIYDELFDELIRQVTINCAERGLLLLRVRDEIHLSMLSYQTLLESAIGYGIRKAIILEQQQNQILLDGDLERIKNVELAKKVEELEKQLQQEALSKEEEIRLLEATMKEEIRGLVESNRTLKMHLQTILQFDQQLQVQQATLNDVTNRET